MHLYKKLKINQEAFRYDWILEEEKLKEEYYRNLQKNNSNCIPQISIEESKETSCNLMANQGGKYINPFDLNQEIRISDISYNFSDDEGKQQNEQQQSRPKINITPIQIINKKPNLHSYEQ